MGARQYGRVYKIIYGDQTGSTKVEFPFTLDNLSGESLRVQFSFSRTNRAEPDRGTLTISNLPKHIRTALKADLEYQLSERIRIQKLAADDATRAKLLLELANIFRVNVFAGYGGPEDLELIFRGDLLNVTTVRRGAVEVSTRIELGDTLLALTHSYVNESFGPNAQALGIVKKLISDMGMAFDGVSEKTLTASILANQVVTFTEGGAVVVGRAPDMITEFVDLFGLQWWVRDGVVYMVPQGAMLSDFSVQLQRGADLMSYTEGSEGGDVSGRALLNPHIAPGRGLILKDFDGGHLDALGFRVSQVVLTGDTRGNSWYVDFMATAVNTELIPPTVEFFFEERTVQDQLDELERQRAS